jgi:phospholipid transport system substrate-binding protein
MYSPMKNLLLMSVLLITTYNFSIAAEIAPKNQLELPINQLEPVEFIKIITTDMLNIVKQNKTLISKDPKQLLQIVDNKIMPFVANNTIARKVMGFKWKTATTKQKQDFTEEFTIYLKRFYSRAFLSYDKQTLVYDPKPKMKGNNIATISTSLQENGKPDIQIDYKLYKQKDGGWIMIDIVVEGISLVINNQRGYGNQIKSEGIDSVIVKLRYNNSKEFK